MVRYLEQQSVLIATIETLLNLFFLLFTLTIFSRRIRRDGAKVDNEVGGKKFVQIGFGFLLVGLFSLLGLFLGRFEFSDSFLDFYFTEAFLLLSLFLVCFLEYSGSIHLRRGQSIFIYVCSGILLILGNVLLLLFPFYWLFKVFIYAVLLKVVLINVSVLLGFRIAYFSRPVRKSKDYKSGLAVFFPLWVATNFLYLSYNIWNDCSMSFIMIFPFYWLLHILILIVYFKKNGFVVISKMWNGNVFSLPPLSTIAMTAKEREGMKFDDITAKIFDYFENDKPYLSKDFSIMDASLALCTNKYYLSRNLNVLVGKSFRDFINYYRVKEAMLIYIKDPSIPVDSLKGMCGFRNSASFINAFKRHSGYLPGEWCRKVRYNVGKANTR